jgi:hypothetical protein
MCSQRLNETRYSETAADVTGMGDFLSDLMEVVGKTLHMIEWAEQPGKKKGTVERQKSARDQVYELWRDFLDKTMRDD